MKTKSQAGVEYLIIIGFVTFIIGSILIIALFYSDQIKDKIVLNQAENFAVQLTSSAESIFFAGEPSKTTVNLYLPKGIRDLSINSSYISMIVRVTSGENKRVYISRVPLQGNISLGEGVKRISLEAKENYVLITQST